ncbi:MAG: hypothetical protein HY059_09985 [Proteobacteria bacterium]|nr:hypothetical protein [Pseudomonadota bacterium]
MTAAAETTDWEAAKKNADAERAAIEAQKLLLQSKKELAALQDPARQSTDTEVAAAKAAKELAEARKGRTDAEVAAFKSQLGDIAASGITGSVQIADKAGALEASLLAAGAMNAAADRIAALVPAQASKRSVLLFGSADTPGFQSLASFRAQTGVVKKLFTDADEAGKRADAKTGVEFTTEAVPAIAAAAVAVEAATKILSYFRSDYTLGGIELTSEDAPLVHALASALARSSKNMDVRLPALYAGPPGAESPAAGELKELLLLKAAAAAKVSHHDAVAAKHAADKDKGKAKAHKDAVDAWKGAAAAFDAFAAKLTAPDEKGNTQLASVARESALAKQLEEGGLLLVAKVHKAGGAYYAKKNLWTFFGGMPLYHMGGVVASFALMDGKTGSVLQSGLVPVHGGFVRAKCLPKAVNGH